MHKIEPAGEREREREREREWEKKEKKIIIIIIKKKKKKEKKEKKYIYIYKPLQKIVYDTVWGVWLASYLSKIEYIWNTAENTDWKKVRKIIT